MNGRNSKWSELEKNEAKFIVVIKFPHQMQRKLGQNIRFDILDDIKKAWPKHWTSTSFGYNIWFKHKKRNSRWLFLVGYVSFVYVYYLYFVVAIIKGVAFKGHDVSLITKMSAKQKKCT